MEFSEKKVYSMTSFIILCVSSQKNPSSIRRQAICNLQFSLSRSLSLWHHSLVISMLLLSLYSKCIDSVTLTMSHPWFTTFDTLTFSYSPCNVLCALRHCMGVFWNCFHLIWSSVCINSLLPYCWWIWSGPSHALYFCLHYCHVGIVETQLSIIAPFSTRGP